MLWYLEPNKAHSYGSSRNHPASASQNLPIPQASLPPPHYVTFSQPLAIKLEGKNFLLWHHQVLVAIKGHNLSHYIDRATKVLLRYAFLEDALQDRVSEEFQLWEQQDQLLLSWLMASMSESIFTQVVECEFMWQVWEKLQIYFAFHTCAREQQLKTELCNTSKGSTSVSEYLLWIKALINCLVFIGCMVLDSEHIAVILGGLSTEYNAFVTFVDTRIDPYSVAEIEVLLLAHESHIEQAQQWMNSTSFQAHVENRDQNPVSSDQSGFVVP